MPSRILPTLLGLLFALPLALPAAASEAQDKMPDLDDVERVVELFLEYDPTMEDYFDDAYGYALFPRVGKGAIGIGGAYGRGAVYIDGVLAGMWWVKSLRKAGAAQFDWQRRQADGATVVQRDVEQTPRRIKVWVIQ